MSQHQRVKITNTQHAHTGAHYVSYWCYKSLRTRHNHSLEYAINVANKHALPLVVFTTFDTHAKPPMSARHAHFLLHTYDVLHKNLKNKDIVCYHLLGFPPAIAAYIAQRSYALVLDTVYLQEDKVYYDTLARMTTCPLLQVESNVTIPIETVSEKASYAAYSLRPKITALKDKFLLPIKEYTIENPSLHLQHPHLHFPSTYKDTASKNSYSIHALAHEDVGTAHTLKTTLSLDWSVLPVTMRGGEDEGQTSLQYFLDHRLEYYDQCRNDPAAHDGIGHISNLSPYLRVGALSPIDVVLQAQRVVEKKTKELAHTDDAAETIQRYKDSFKTFFEELVVRRELAYNFVRYNHNYTNYNSIPVWAHNTLEAHSTDVRAITYAPHTMEDANTDDPYWNAAQIQLVRTGTMHGYMRMYWGKKILEWTENPKEAYEFTVEQNDKYAIDAPDPNGYAGISWCYGTHDRPHPERQIFGSIRFMNANGLRRKFKIDTYVKAWTKQK